MARDDVQGIGHWLLHAQHTAAISAAAAAS
jgi:hypothetical protein